MSMLGIKVSAKLGGMIYLIELKDRSENKKKVRSKGTT